MYVPSGLYVFNAVKLADLTLLNEALSMARSRSSDSVPTMLVDMRLVELNMLRQHEEANSAHLRELKKEIESDKILKFAIVVDKNTNIILDGEHRFSALKELGCNKVPVVFVDYNSPSIEVYAWRNGEQLTKKDVIEAGLSQKKFPPTTSKHMIRMCNTRKHISVIEKRVNISLEKLRADVNDCR